MPRDALLVVDIHRLRADVQRALELLERRGESESAEKGGQGQVDKVIDRISKASTFFSTVVLASVGLLFTSVTSCNQARQNATLEQERADNARLDVMKSFIEPVSKKEQRYIAITTIASLGHQDLALKLAELYPEDGTAAAISILSEKRDDRQTRGKLDAYIQKALDFIVEECERTDGEVDSLMDWYQRIPHAELARPFYEMMRLPANHRLRSLVEGLPVSSIATVARNLASVRDLSKTPGPLKFDVLEVPSTLSEPTDKKMVRYLQELDVSVVRSQVEEGKKAIGHFRDFTDLFTQDYLRSVDKVETDLDALQERLRAGEPKISVLLNLMDLYIRSEEDLNRAKEDWKAIRKSFTDFVSTAQARSRNQPANLEEAFSKLTHEINRIKSKRFDTLFQNAKSISTALRAS
jgi:hypothetical protein